MFWKEEPLCRPPPMVPSQRAINAVYVIVPGRLPPILLFTHIAYICLYIHMGVGGGRHRFFSPLERCTSLQQRIATQITKITDVKLMRHHMILIDFKFNFFCCSSSRFRQPHDLNMIIQNFQI